MQLLPTKILHWVDQKDFSLDNYRNDSPIGFFLQVDLDYLHELHDLYNEYPSEGEKINVRKEILSNHQLQIIEDNNYSLGKNNFFLPI